MTKTQITRELPTTFTKGDKTYTMIKLTAKGYIFKVEDTHINHVYYEVFKRKTQKVYDFENKVTTDDRMVVYPSNEAFGSWAWCMSFGDNHKRAYTQSLSKLSTL